MRRVVLIICCALAKRTGRKGFANVPCWFILPDFNPFLIFSYIHHCWAWAWHGCWGTVPGAMTVMHPWGLLWLSGAGSEGAWAHFRKREKMTPCLTTTATATVVLEVSMNTLFAGETCKGFESFRILNSFRLFCGWNAVRSTERPGVASIRSSCSWNLCGQKVVEKLGLVRNLEQERTYQNTLEIIRTP